MATPRNPSPDGPRDAVARLEYEAIETPRGYVLGSGVSASDVLKSTRELLESEGLNPDWLDLDAIKETRVDGDQ